MAVFGMDPEKLEGVIGAGRAAGLSKLTEVDLNELRTILKDFLGIDVRNEKEALRVLKALPAEKMEALQVALADYAPTGPRTVSGPTTLTALGWSNRQIKAMSVEQQAQLLESGVTPDQLKVAAGGASTPPKIPTGGKPPVFVSNPAQEGRIFKNAVAALGEKLGMKGRLAAVTAENARVVWQDTLWTFIGKQKGIAAGVTTLLQDVVDRAWREGHMVDPTPWTQNAFRGLMTGGGEGSIAGLPKPVQDYYQQEVRARFPKGLLKTEVARSSETLKAALATHLPAQGKKSLEGGIGRLGEPIVPSETETVATKFRRRLTKAERKIVKGLPPNLLKLARQAGVAAAASAGGVGADPLHPRLAAMLSAGQGQVDKVRAGREAKLGGMGAKITRWLQGGKSAQVARRGLGSAIMKSPGALILLLSMPGIMDWIMGISHGRQLEAATPDPVGMVAQAKAGRIQQRRLMDLMRYNPEMGQQMMGQLNEQQALAGADQQALEGPVPGRVPFGGRGGGTGL